MNIISKSIITAFLLVMAYEIQAQEADRPHLWRDRWEWTLNLGPTLFWGDMSDDVNQPFEKFLKQDENKFSFSAGLNKYVGPFGFRTQVIAGRFSGVRNKWSDGVPASSAFVGNIIHYDLKISLDPITLFAGYNPNRRIGIEGYGGIGNIHYNSTKTNTITNQTSGTIKSSSLVVPFGGSLKYRINDKWGVQGSNIWVYAFKDDLDAHVGTGTNINDMYSYTSVGVTYRFALPERKPKPPVYRPDPEVKPDPVIAEKPRVISDTEGELSTKVLVSLPEEIEQGEEFTIDVRIEMAAAPASARIQQTFPYGFSITQPEDSKGEYRFRDMIMSINWNPYPETNILQYSFKAKALDIKPGEYNIPGLLLYQVDNVDKVYQFKNMVTIKQPIPVVTVEKITEPEKTVVVEPVKPAVTEPVKPATTTPTKPATTVTAPPAPLAGLEYRVQVRAIHGGKESANRIQNELKLSTPVFEDLHRGYYKYSTGQFTNYQEANELKNYLRANQTTSDAFVVAFYNGQRLNSLADVPAAASMQTPASSAPQTRVQGTSYKVQIAAVSKSSQHTASHFATLYGITEPISEEMHNGLRKFTVGSFTEYTTALQYLQQMRQRVKDAFLVQYVDGIR